MFAFLCSFRRNWVPSTSMKTNPSLCAIFRLNSVQLIHKSKKIKWPNEGGAYICRNRKIHISSICVIAFILHSSQSRQAHRFVGNFHEWSITTWPIAVFISSEWENDWIERIVPIRCWQWKLLFNEYSASSSASPGHDIFNWRLIKWLKHSF